HDDNHDDDANRHDDNHDEADDDDNHAEADNDANHAAANVPDAYIVDDHDQDEAIFVVNNVIAVGGNEHHRAHDHGDDNDDHGSPWGDDNQTRTRRARARV